MLPENICIVDELKFINLNKVFNSTYSKIYYLNNNFLSKIFGLILSRKFKKLQWKLIDIKNESSNKIAADVFENTRVEKCLVPFLNDLSKNLHLKDSDKKNFINYLAKYLSTNKNIINRLSIENVIILVESVQSIFKSKKIEIILQSSFFDQYICQHINKKNVNFLFYKNFFLFSKIYFVLSILKNCKFLFIKTKNNLNKNSTLMIEDSYQINNPFEFFKGNLKKQNMFFVYFLDQYTKKYKDSLIKDGLSFVNIREFIDIAQIFNFLLNFININKFFANKKYYNFGLHKILLKFFFEKKIYEKAFNQLNTMIYFTSSITYPHTSSAIAALDERKGISTAFTISSSEINKIEEGIDSFDIFFSFKPKTKKILTQNSNLKYFIKIGYNGDYKFKNISQEAAFLRQKLINQGSKFIIGFFDQGDSADPMFRVGYETSRIGYEYLLKKLISNNNLGLIIKPKKPGLIKEKLGPVYNLLLQALETKRCIAFLETNEAHVKNFIDIPAKTALASDLTIHDTLLAGTAGLESALVGKKSVFFDFYGSKKSIFWDESLNIAFKNWDDLWLSVEKNIMQKNLKLGNWQDLIDKFDPYRDKNTNKRICYYINQLIECLEKGFSKKETIDISNQNYLKIWNINEKEIIVKAE